jgi:hypothetical protein
MRERHMAHEIRNNTNRLKGQRIQNKKNGTLE